MRSMWLSSLKHHFSKKRAAAAAAASVTEEEADTAEPLSWPSPGPGSDEEEYQSRKRRSVSIDMQGPRCDPNRAGGADRRTSLEQWHEARRARNSMEGTGTTTTDRLTVCKAGSTTIVNKTYITIKHLGSGTFGRVMLCFNVYDQRLYAIKVCRKSQFAQSVSRYHSSSRLRRGSHNNLPSPSSSTPGPGRSSGAMAGGGSGGSFSGPLPPLVSSCGGSTSTHVTNICATSSSADIKAAAAAAALLLGSGGGMPGGGATAGPPSAGGWAAFSNQQLLPALPQLQPDQQQLQQQLRQQQGLPPVPQQQEAVCGAKPLPPPRHPAAPPPGSVAADLAQQQRGSRTPGSIPSSCAVAAATAGGGGGPLLSSGSAGWGLGTDCSTGSLSGGSVFAEALMRFQTEELVKEIAILKKLNHPNIVNLVEVIDDPSTDSLLLVMEYVEGGTLEPRQVSSSRWEPLAEKDVWRYVREVLQGLDYLHHHRVVHGDLKPANLLLDGNSNKVKIADFGSSIMAGSDKIFSMRNCPGFSTPAFRSPESLNSGYQPSFEMDMWALGVCIYMWVFGSLPFMGKAPFIIYEKIRAQPLTLPPAPEVSPELKDLVRRLLDKDVLHRPDVLAAMAHPWVTLGGSAPLASISQGSTGQQPGGGGLGQADVQVSQADIDAAIRQIGSSMHEMMDVVFEEEVISAGEAADRIYLIARGEVEILAAPGSSSSGGGGGAAGAGGGGAADGQLISGLSVEVGEPPDSDMWDSTHISDLSKSPGTTSMMLLNDGLPPWDTSSSRAGGGGGSSSGRRLLGVKGPGDSLGVPLSSASAGGAGCRDRERRWKVCVVARGEVTLFRAALADLDKLVAAHPEMQGAVSRIVTQQETDMLVAEAMRQLRLYNDCLRVPDVVMANS